MSISKTIDFSGVKISKAFHNQTKAYAILNSMNEGAWKSYTNQMLLKNTSVKYDAHLDAYVAAPLKEAQMTNKKYLLQDEEEDDGLDMELNSMDLVNSIDQDDEIEIAPEEEIYPAEEPVPSAPVVPAVSQVLQPEPVAPVSSPSIDLTQLEALLTKILSANGSGGVTQNPAAPTMPASQVPGPGVISGNILDTEFENNAENIDFIEQKKDDTYMSLIDPSYSQKKASMAGTDSAMADITGVENDIEGVVMSNAYDVNDQEELNEWDEEDEYDLANSKRENLRTSFAGRDLDDEKTITNNNSHVIHPKKKTNSSDTENELNEWGASEEAEMTHFGKQTGTLKEDLANDDEEMASAVQKIKDILVKNGISLEEDYIYDFIDFELNTIDSFINNPKILLAKIKKYLSHTDTSGEEELNEWSASENDEYAHYGQNTGTLREDDGESFDEDDLSGEDEDEDEEEDFEDEETGDEPLTAFGTANVGGQAVQIILTGVMISPSQVSQVAESAKKSGMKLKSVKGAGKTVNFIIESNSKTYNLKYEYTKNAKAKNAFSLSNYTLQSLNGVSVKKQNTLREAKSFSQMMSKDILNRSITNVKESDILKEFNGKISKDYQSNWNIKNVGQVNLKNGLNETYSNITAHSKEKNTLVKTKDGQFYLLKGNLKERSEVGTKKQLIDLEGNRDYGTGTVVGIYENSIKGLEQIMFKTQRTTLLLLTWK